MKRVTAALFVVLLLVLPAVLLAADLRDGSTVWMWTQPRVSISPLPVREMHGRAPITGFSALPHPTPPWMLSPVVRP